MILANEIGFDLQTCHVTSSFYCCFRLFLYYHRCFIDRQEIAFAYIVYIPCKLIINLFVKPICLTTILRSILTKLLNFVHGWCAVLCCVRESARTRAINKSKNDITRICNSLSRYWATEWFDFFFLQFYLFVHRWDVFVFLISYLWWNCNATLLE